MHPPEFALHVAGEGAAEPVATTLALLSDAVRRGATLHYQTLFLHYFPKPEQSGASKRPKPGSRPMRSW